MHHVTIGDAADAALAANAQAFRNHICRVAVGFCADHDVGGMVGERMQLIAIAPELQHSVFALQHTEAKLTHVVDDIVSRR